GGAIADVERMVCEALGDAAQALEVPGRIAVGSEEVAAHVVVDAVDLPATVVEERCSLRSDETAAAGDEDPLHALDSLAAGGAIGPLSRPWRSSSPCARMK